MMSLSVCRRGAAIHFDRRHRVAQVTRTPDRSPTIGAIGANIAAAAQTAETSAPPGYKEQPMGISPDAIFELGLSFLCRRMR